MIRVESFRPISSTSLGEGRIAGSQSGSACFTDARDHHLCESSDIFLDCCFHLNYIVRDEAITDVQLKTRKIAAAEFESWCDGLDLLQLCFGPLRCHLQDTSVTLNVITRYIRQMLRVPESAAKRRVTTLIHAPDFLFSD